MGAHPAPTCLPACTPVATFRADRLGRAARAELSIVIAARVFAHPSFRTRAGGPGSALVEHGAGLATDGNATHGFFHSSCNGPAQWWALRRAHSIRYGRSGALLVCEILL